MLTPYNFYNWIKEFDSLANASVSKPYLRETSKLFNKTRSRTERA